MSAPGHARYRGIMDASNENAANTPNRNKLRQTARDGRHSCRKLTDPLDEVGEFDILTGLVAQEPAPQPIVLAVQQP